MTEDGFSIDTRAFDEALARALSESKREPVVLMKEQAKGVVKTLIEITPPAHEGVTGAAARQHGAAKVKGDIAKIYGTPSQAYALMKDQAPAVAMAKGFWKHYQDGEFERAKDLFRSVTGESFNEFDDGKLHQSRRNARGRVGGLRRGKPLMWTWNKKALDAYVKDKVGMVGWLAAGWNFAAAMLGFRPLAWIWKHPAPGAGTVNVSDEGVKIKLTNQVSYAGDVDGWRRRVQWALDRQAGAMRDRSKKFMEVTMKRAGFKLAA